MGRLCTDFRKLNDATWKDAQPLPRIDETLEVMGGACYFSNLDLVSGYWQVELDPKNKKKTAYISYTLHGLYQFNVIPFALCNATFQRLVLAGLHWSVCLVYLDDIIVFNSTVDRHLEILREVLTHLRSAGLKIKSSECDML